MVDYMRSVGISEVKPGDIIFTPFPSVVTSITKCHLHYILELSNGSIRQYRIETEILVQKNEKLNLSPNNSNLIHYLSD